MSHDKVLDWGTLGPQGEVSFCLAVWLLAFKLEKPVSHFPFQPRLGIFALIAPASQSLGYLGVNVC